MMLSNVVYGCVFCPKRVLNSFCVLLRLLCSPIEIFHKKKLDFGHTVKHGLGWSLKMVILVILIRYQRFWFLVSPTKGILSFFKKAVKDTVGSSCYPHFYSVCRGVVVVLYLQIV